MGGLVSSIFGGGSSGSSTTAAPQSTTSNVYQTNIPDYAQPYVQNMLNATQSQLFQTDANGNITGFNQYQPYSGMTQDQYNAASQAVAGFTPLQQQAQSGAANLQLPGQFQQATNLTNAGIMGALGTTRQAAQYGQQGNMYGQMGAGQSNMYGQQGNMAGQQAAGMSNMLGMNAVGQGQQGAAIGQSLGQMSTNPGAVQSYMNPYVQASLNPQLQLLGQQTGIQSAAEQSAATSAGAFGGSREALQNSLVQQGGNLAAQQAIGQGYNTAYTNAMNQMNAANQAALAGNAQAQTGYGQGLTAANQAGQLGMAGAQLGLSGANQAANLGIAGAQAGLSGVGAQQAGYNQAMSGAGQLGSLGTSQLGAETSILGTQAQAGAIQQANAQQIINQGIQNYATQQQYPLMELGTMSNMLRGLPMQSATTSSYQAAPSALTQAVGTAGVASQLAAKGGLLKTKKYAGGGILDATRDDLEAMPSEDLQKEENTTSSPTIKSQIKQILAMRAGAPMTAAGGGILAFSDGNDGQPIGAENYQDAAAVLRGQPMNATPPEQAGPPVSASQAAINQQIQQAYINQAIRDAAEQKAKQSAQPASPAQNPQAITSVPPSNNNMPMQPNGSDVPFVVGSPEMAAAQKLQVQAQQAPAQATAPATAPSSTPAAAPTPAPANQGIKGAAPAAPAPADNRTPHQKVEEKARAATIDAFNDPNRMNKLDSLFGVSAPGADFEQNYLANKAAYVGPNDTESQVAKLEERRSRELQSADERNKLIKMQAFATMAKTPGSFLVAAMTGVQSAVPGLIANADKRDEAMNHIDDAISNVYKSDRLEKASDFDAAAKAKQEAAKSYLEANKILMDEHVAQIKANAEIQAAGIRAVSGGEGSGKDLNGLLTRRNSIDQTITAREKTLGTTLSIANLPDSTDKETQKQILAARTRVKQEMGDLYSERDQLNQLIGQHPKMAGITQAAPSNTAANQPLYATNGKDRIVSTDGGKTWQPVGAK